MAKKTSGTRSPSKKQTTKKASTRKKVTKKSSSSKKATTAKKTTTRKKSPSKASTSKKTTTKKTTTKKSTTKKTTTKKAPASKKATTKKTPASKKSGSTRSKSKSSSGSKSSSKAPRRRFGGGDAKALKASKDAAARLAAAAGLAPIASSQEASTKTSRYKKLTKSPFNKQQLDEFREILRAKRALIVGDVSSMEMEALTGGGSGALSHLPQHMADQGSDTFDQSLNLDLAASQRKLLKEIDDALARIENGTYGVCEKLGKQIKIERLRHTPWARYSIDAARQLELNGNYGRD